MLFIALSSFIRILSQYHIVLNIFLLSCLCLRFHLTFPGGRLGSGGPLQSLLLQLGLHGARPGQGRHHLPHGVHRLHVRAGRAAPREAGAGGGQAADLPGRPGHRAFPGKPLHWEADFSRTSGLAQLERDFFCC